MAGKQIVMLEVVTLDDDAQPPGEWDWSDLVGDPVKVLGAGDFVTVSPEEMAELGFEDA